MSSNLPPATPDYLEAGGGPAEPRQGGGRGRRIALIGGGAAIIALVGSGVWAWNFWFSQGAQPSEALPADTLAYVALDLDPTGEQQIEAVEALGKFEVLEDEFDFDLGARDDIKKWVFERIQDEDDVCPELDYDDDLKDWLGDRFAFAVVEVDGEPRPVAVVQVKDAGKAADGVERLIDCGLGDGDASGWAVEGDWMVLAETEEIATDVLDAGKDSPLSEDEDYQELTEAAGDAGVLTVYAAPEAGSALMDTFGTEILEEMAQFGGMVGDDFSEQFRSSMEGFGGAAGSLRFDDGDLELEFVTGEFRGDLAEVTPFRASEIGDLVGRLPEASAGAFAVGIPDGYVDSILEMVRPIIEAESGMSFEDAIAELEAVSGLEIPDDFDTLLGDAVAVVADSDIDADDLESEGPSALRAAILVQGDPGEIELVLDKIRGQLGSDAAFLQSAADGDLIAIGPNPDYLEEVVSGGDLGDDQVFEKVVPEGDDSTVVLYVDFDRNDWLVELAEDTGAPDDVLSSLRPLDALGVSAWDDDGEGHLLLKLALD